ncbi:MAG: bifunctional [glutamate--ammonia ligase]-adenylyl-L-tyrosine phosphorylase/[glutamate--ammonia-ligase] adenylyltransferase [Actinobacteria bacterium]|nr:bifunctional [glutamate--ammonia ligase]-adenylyl-L-tyrosine phosphorylase/[glutamate--ammonia-ligase] adenylyltransferase [Actinomycetota bacterium]
MNIPIRELSAQTPDLERSFKNLERLLQSAPETFKEHAHRINSIAMLFAYSQFLADYCVKNPGELDWALKNIHTPVTKQGIISASPRMGMVDKNMAMKTLRGIKKRYILQITLRDITGITNLDECMVELSILAEAIIELALDASYVLMQERFGDIGDNPFSIIALGKLGAGELNYSSDVDIISVYGSREGLSSGVLAPSGVSINKIEPHEYFCRLTELLASLLQTQTEDGIAYRVDLRLRPDGRKGEISHSLDAYMSYYEAWGKTWERMALIRARPVAGDRLLGKTLIDAVEPFIWKRSTDYYDIEEIKELKRKIDTIFDANDIKRGYGGIREIEFFTQTFQLLYGGEKENLRAGKLVKVLQELLKEGFLSEDDVKVLEESNTFLRRLEHILQMKDDIQTHSLPSQPDELEVLSKKMGFCNEREFISELKLKRLMVRDMYNSLLGEDDIQPEVTVLLEDELTDNEIRDYLSFKGFKDPNLALKNIKALNDQISLGKTIRQRTILRNIIPMFLEQVVKLENRDGVLSTFTTFIEKVGGHESYIDLLSRRPDTMKLIVGTLSKSSYLTRSLLSHENLESLFEYPDIRMDYGSIRERLLGVLQIDLDPMSTVREFRIIEEMRAGMLFLEGILDVEGLSNKLSTLADTIVRTTLRYLGAVEDFAIVALGRSGAGELSIGSDLDLIFISDREKSNRLAEELIKFLSEYTAKGIVYKVDMRLRPDGSKGILVNSIEGYRNYYLKSAHPWEIQALLRARTIAGDRDSLRAFNNLKRQVIIQRGSEVTGPYIEDMRSRIVSKLSKESNGYDIKLGPGGIEEIQFLIQYLQLEHAAKHPDLITHKTVNAVKRLIRHSILDSDTAELLLHAYGFMRTVETLLRFNEEHTLKPNSNLVTIIAEFLDLKSGDELVRQIEETRNKVLETTMILRRIQEPEGKSAGS